MLEPDEASEDELELGSIGWPFSTIAPPIRNTVLIERQVRQKATLLRWDHRRELLANSAVTTGSEIERHLQTLHQHPSLSDWCTVAVLVLMTWTMCSGSLYSDSNTPRASSPLNS